MPGPIDQVTCPPTGQPILDFTIGVCRGNPDDCGFTATGSVSCNSAGKKPVQVYMVVNRSCPDCTGTNNTCATAAGKPWMFPATSVTWNNTTKLAAVSFGTVNSENDPRLVLCGSTNAICFVVCYEDGNCKTKTYTNLVPNTICNNLCPDCAYTNGDTAP